MRTSKKTAHATHSSYLERINRVLDHVFGNLAGSLRLSDLADMAELSPFHFHRVFQAMVGETPSDFVKRLRLERALYFMSVEKRMSLTDIAFRCGFSSSSDFTRSFKQRYGVAPSKFDLNGLNEEQHHQVIVAAKESPFRLQGYRDRANPDKFRVRLLQLPVRNVAYIRVSNPYQGDGVVQAAQRLMAWAKERQLDHGQWLGYQYESPRVTPLERCHYCVGIEVPSELNPKGEVGLVQFPPMLVAEVAMKGDIELEIRLFQWLYGSWLPRSRYVPDDHPCFEAWHGKPFEHGLEHFELSIHLPLKR